jgi:hypothetical protein
MCRRRSSDGSTALRAEPGPARSPRGFQTNRQDEVAAAVFKLHSFAANPASLTRRAVKPVLEHHY